MEIQSAFASGVQGFQNATEKANQAAEDIVASTAASEENASLTLAKPTTTPNLNESIVELKVAEYQAKSSAEVIKTADETLGTLLDVRV